MATSKTITVAPIVAGPRVYPHVDAITDPHAKMTIRQIWDRIHAMTDQLTANQTSITTAVDQINANTKAGDTAATNAAAALAIAQKTAGSLASGAATGAGGTAGGSGGTGSDPNNPGGTGGTTPPTQGGPAAPSTPVTIDGISVVINGGSPDVSGWAVTTHLDAIDIGTVTPVFGKQTDPGSWPDIIPPGFSGPLQYTLWIFEQHGGQWYASGIIQFWRGRTVGGGNISCNNEVAKNWCYDSRWGPMAGYQPQPGETIGFMVTAGNQRGTDDHIVAERSNIVFIRFPTCGGPTAFPPYVSET
jgi:hypothetical protein